MVSCTSQLGNARAHRWAPSPHQPANPPTHQPAASQPWIADMKQQIVHHNGKRPSWLVLCAAMTHPDLLPLSRIFPQLGQAPDHVWMRSTAIPPTAVSKTPSIVLLLQTSTFLCRQCKFGTQRPEPRPALKQFLYIHKGNGAKNYRTRDASGNSWLLTWSPVLSC